MSFVRALRVAGSALTAQRLRTDIIANNVANMNTTRTPEGGPYRRQQLVFAARQERPPFAALLLARAAGAGAPASLMQRLATGRPGEGVQVANLLPDARPPKRVFEPDHPDADANGMVQYPDIDPVTEMTDLLSATRAYEANVTVLNAAKSMALRALDIGR
jgi:flagellar basal-body rod protein FlgC